MQAFYACVCSLMDYWWLNGGLGGGIFIGQRDWFFLKKLLDFSLVCTYKICLDVKKEDDMLFRSD